MSKARYILLAIVFLIGLSSAAKIYSQDSPEPSFLTVQQELKNSTEEAILYLESISNTISQTNIRDVYKNQINTELAAQIQQLQISIASVNDATTIDDLNSASEKLNRTWNNFEEKHSKYLGFILVTQHINYIITNQNLLTELEAVLTGVDQSSDSINKHNSQIALAKLELESALASANLALEKYNEIDETSNSNIPQKQAGDLLEEARNSAEYSRYYIYSVLIALAEEL